MSNQMYIVFSSAFYTIAEAVRWADRQKTQLAHTGSRAYVMQFMGRWYVVRTVTSRDRNEIRMQSPHGGGRDTTLLQYIADLESRYSMEKNSPNI